MEYFVVILLLLISFCVGWRLGINNLTRKAQRIVEEAYKIQKETTVTLKMERYNDGFLFYNKDTEEFVGSAKTKEEIVSFLEKNYSDKSFYINQTDIQMLEKASAK